MPVQKRRQLTIIRITLEIFLKEVNIVHVGQKVRGISGGYFLPLILLSGTATTIKQQSQIL